MLSLLGVADPSTLTEWFAALADGARVVDSLQERRWGATDGQLIDRYGLHWLIGYPTLPINLERPHLRRHPAKSVR